MEKFDVIIVGAGPGGSMAALVLSRAGQRVLVIEKASFPRPKVCGCTLHPGCGRIWERHGLSASLDQLPQFKPAGFNLEQEGIPFVRHRYRTGGSRAVERGILDQWLAGEAGRSGASFRFGVTVKDITDGRVPTSDGEFAAPVVIGADGRNSVVGRLAGLSQPPRPGGRVAWQAFVDAGTVSDHVQMNVFPEGYYGVTRLDTTRADLTMILFAEARINPEEIVRRYLPGATGETWKSAYFTAQRPRDITDGRVWLVGDAARVLEPLTGEGIYSAIATGEMAARHILSIGKIGATAAAANYRREHRRFYRSRSLVNSLTRWALHNAWRSRRVVGILKLWPGLVDHLIERVLNR